MRTLPLMKQGLIPVSSERITSVARSGELLGLQEIIDLDSDFTGLGDC